MRPNKRNVKAAVYYWPLKSGKVNTYEKWRKYEADVFSRFWGVIRTRMMEALCLEEDKFAVKKAFIESYGRLAEKLFDDVLEQYTECVDINKLMDKKGWPVRKKEKEGKVSITRWPFYISIEDPIRPYFGCGMQIQEEENKGNIVRESVETPYTQNITDGFFMEAGEYKEVLQDIMQDWRKKK